MLTNQNILRLIQFDDSGNFKINVFINDYEKMNGDIQVNKKSKITFNTTLNKARIISKNIDQLYKEDNSLDHYDINFNDLQEQNKTQKIIEAFQLLLNSFGNSVNISNEQQHIFSLILEYLGENGIINNESIVDIISCMKRENKNIIISAGNSNKSPYSTHKFTYDSDKLTNFYYNFTDYFFANGEDDTEGWIEFDFNDKKINLKTYHIRSSHNYNPKSWRIEGSNDKKSWDVLDYQKDAIKLSEHYEEENFECKPNETYYRFIRYVQIEQWTNDIDKIINIADIKFFGTINNSEGIMNEDLGFDDIFD